jgi:hypothetical protein
MLHLMAATTARIIHGISGGPGIIQELLHNQQVIDAMKPEIFVGIDVAYAKNKRLPLCIATLQRGQLVPIELPI